MNVYANSSIFWNKIMNICINMNSTNHTILKVVFRKKRGGNIGKRNTCLHD